MSDSCLLSSEASLSSSDSLDSFSNFDKLKPYRSSRLEVFCKKGVLRNFTKLTGKHLCQSLIFNKAAGLRHRCFPVNFAKFLRTPFCRTPYDFEPTGSNNENTDRAVSSSAMQTKRAEKE